MGSALSRLAVLVLLAVSISVAACTIERGDVRTPGGQPPEADTTRVRLTMEAIAAAFLHQVSDCCIDPLASAT